MNALVITEEPLLTAVLQWMNANPNDRVLADFGQVFVVLFSYRRIGWSG
mgnify:CR=1 FL=1